MYDLQFHCETNAGRIGVRTNKRPVKSMVTCVKSPYASPITNYWLERRILKLYTAYYKKVMRESRGKFWEECREALKNEVYETLLF